MHKSLSLRKNFLWTFTGHVVNAASLWGVIVVATKIGNVAMVGQLELSRAIGMPIIAITLLRLRVIQVTDAKNEYAFRDYFGTRLVMAIVGMLVFVIIASTWYRGEMAWIIVLWGLAKSIDSVSDIVRGLFQRHECMNLSGISLMLRGPAALLSVGLLLWLTGELKLALVGLVLVWLLVLFLYDLPQAYHLLCHKSVVDGVSPRVLPRFKTKTILALLWIALPLGIVMILSGVQGSVPKLVLESYHGGVALGYFGPLVYPLTASSMVISAMAQSASPRLANYYVSNLRAYCHLMWKLLLLALVMGLLFAITIALFGRFALTVLYTVDYARHHIDFIILSVGSTASFMLFFCGHGLTAARAFRVQLFLAIASCLVAIISSFLLIPPYGIRGAAVASVVTLFVMFAGYFGTLLCIIRKRQNELNMDDANTK